MIGILMTPRKLTLMKIPGYNILKNAKDVFSI